MSPDLLSITPEVPDDPLVPEDPLDPLVPELPDDPDTPLVPEDPDVPLDPNTLAGLSADTLFIASSQSFLVAKVYVNLLSYNFL